jgi:hypothetical protein
MITWKNLPGRAISAVRQVKASSLLIQQAQIYLLLLSVVSPVRRDWGTIER